MEKKMTHLPNFEAARAREAAAALTAQYRQIGSGAVLAAVLAITRQRELLARAPLTTQQSA